MYSEVTMPETEKTKRKVHRSPGYPFFDLTEAIQKADAVYKAEKRTATTLEVIASHMGYSQAVGIGGRAVSALRQYGLIEESSGQYRISDLGYTLIHFDHNSEEWRRAVIDAAARPILFKELAEKYQNNASDATLRNELLNRGFNPTSVPEVITIFRNTMSLAGQAEGSYTVGEELAMQPESAATSVAPPVAYRPPAGVAELSIPVEFSEDGQQAVVARVLFNAPIKREYLTRLKSFLEAWEKALPQ
jgi:hypothetical protein